MEMVGYFVVGDGKFGEYLFDKNKNHVNHPVYVVNEVDVRYWENRGYKVIPAYVINEDYDDYKVYVPEENE